MHYLGAYRGTAALSADDDRHTQGHAAIFPEQSVPERVGQPSRVASMREDLAQAIPKGHWCLRTG
jgi:hypothetical protein